MTAAVAPATTALLQQRQFHFQDGRIRQGHSARPKETKRRHSSLWLVLYDRSTSTPLLTPLGLSPQPADLNLSVRFPPLQAITQLLRRSTGRDMHLI